MPEAAVLLSMRGIVRRFGKVAANDGIDLDVRRGQIVGLLGENGSGKSTLMKVLFGMIRPDHGGIIFKGRELSDHRPADAMAAGLAMIHQHFTLVEAASVMDNVMLGWPEAGGVLRRRHIAGRVRETSARFGLDLDPHARVADLPLGRRQRVEILKAILRGADLLILDEPTSNLAPAEVASLLAVLRNLRDAGAGVVFISHKLPEVLALCDDVVVLRAGRVSARIRVAEASREDLAAAMIGRDLSPSPRGPAPLPGPVRLSVTGLRGSGLAGIDLELRAGEILGVAGVDGNGQLELVETLAGTRRASSGRIMLDGRDLTQSSVAARIRAGLAYIPADRARISLVPRMSIAENLLLRQDERWKAVRGRRAREAAARALMARFDIRAAGPHAAAATLSGGNQQKIVIARELDRRPAVLIAHQATWGLDPGATGFVLRQVQAMRDAEAAVLYVSSELEDVLAIADRIAVLFGGGFAGTLSRMQADPGRLASWMSGGATA
jgi:ABC-type uncharacterized transport system ATPase subunit